MSQSHSSPSTVLVVGASGQIGSGIVRLLRAQGLSVRSTTSKKAAGLLDGGVEQVQLNLSTGEGLRAAFEGIDRAFFLSPPGYADMYGMLSPLIQESKRRGLKKVVLMTAMGADIADTTPFRRAELELEKSSLTYNILRPNWFFQNFNSYWVQGIREQSKLFVPAGQAKASFIDVADVSAVAVRLLLSDDLANRAFNLTGPEAVDHEQVARAISEVSGKRVEYVDLPPEALKQGLLASGLAADYVDFFMMIVGALKAGYAAPLTGEVERILGRKPTSLQQYVEKNRAAWA